MLLLSRLQDRKERTHSSLRGSLGIYQTQIQREEEQKQEEELSYGLQNTPRQIANHTTKQPNTLYIQQ